MRSRSRGWDNETAHVAGPRCFAALLLPVVASCGDSGSPFRAPVPVRSSCHWRWMAHRQARRWSSCMANRSRSAAYSDAGAIFARPMDADGGRWQVAVVGTEVSGKLFSFDVPDVNRPEAYSAELIQVAEPSRQPAAGHGGLFASRFSPSDRGDRHAPAFQNCDCVLLMARPSRWRRRGRPIPDHWLTLETLTSQLSLSSDQVRR